MSDASQTIELLKDLIEIPSPYPDESRIGEFMYGYLKDREGVQVIMSEVEPRRYNIIATKGSGDKLFGFCGHLDTVKLVSGWTVEPHAAVIKDDRLYGLGAYDMKGGIAAMVRAFVDAKPTNSQIVLILTIDEENVGAGCEHFLRTELAKKISHLVVCEPAFTNGQQGIVTGRSGWGWINIALSQPPKHFNEYMPPRDLQLLWAKTLEYIHTLNREEKSYGGKQFIYARETHAQGSGLSLCTSITAQCDCSILVPDSGVGLAEKIKGFISKQIGGVFDSMIQFTVSFDPGARTYYAPYTTPQDSSHLDALKSAVHKITSKAAVPYFRSSVSDENILAAAGISVLGIGAEGYGAHAPDEWVSISSVQKLKSILSEYLNLLDK